MEVTEEASGISSMSRMLDVLGLNHFSYGIYVLTGRLTALKVGRLTLEPHIHRRMVVVRP